MKKLLMMTVAAAMLPLAQADVVWDGGATDGGNLLTQENWSGDVAPAAGDTAAIGDIGYPCTAENEAGELVTLYYQHNPKQGSQIYTIIWKAD